MALETFEKLPQEKKDRILSAGIIAFSQKAYKEVSTDNIVKQCQISKGVLFHYFGSKKAFYLYCLEVAMARLTAVSQSPRVEGFYEILFASMNQKVSLCLTHKDEMHLVNMASRDASEEISIEKAVILRKYTAAAQKESMQILQAAVSYISFKDPSHRQKTVQGLYIYINAILNKYLMQYQQTPDLFFENSESIKSEIKEYLNLMLYGICTQEEL